MGNDDEVKGRAKGGLAVAAKMTKEQKLERARKGALARWADRPVRALGKGNFKEHFGVDVDCYVIDDDQRTAVISQTGMAIALGLSPRGNSFPNFFATRAMADSVGGELRQRLEKPLVIQWTGGSGGLPPLVVHGHDAALLIEVCNAIADADRKGRLGKRYAKVVEQAAIINGASAKSGIKGLVYALTGYRPEIEQVIQAFKLYVQEEAKKYEQEFPNELYAEWHRLYAVPEMPRGKPWLFKKLTVDHVYFPLAKSQGKILELMRANKSFGGDRSKKLFQFLNDIGARALRTHMGRLLEISETSKDQQEYERRITERFGIQQEFNFESPEATSSSEPQRPS